MIEFNSRYYLLLIIPVLFFGWVGYPAARQAMAMNPSQVILLQPDTLMDTIVSDTSAVRPDSLKFSLTEDSPIVRALDSLADIKYFRDYYYNADTAFLNVYPYSFEVPPVFPDSVYRNRIRFLDQTTPIELEYNEDVKRWILLYANQKRQLTSRVLGLALVYFSFFIVMYREGLPAGVLLIGFALAALMIASILMAPNTLAIIITAIALLFLYLQRRMVRKKKGVVMTVILIWALCVGIQRFAVPYVFGHVLQKHQVERIYDLFGKDNPYAEGPSLTEQEKEDAKKKKESSTSYNVRQSKIAIGSGGFWGKGVLKATQTRYDFVPEQRTDFIFCTVGEGFGFLGSFILLGLYLVLLFRIVTIAERQRSVFSRTYAYGVASVFFFHILINISMTVGLAPVIGIPLPFISYGGTSLITFTIMLFALIRLDADRQMVLR